jgi:hypothetical protein
VALFSTESSAKGVGIQQTRQNCRLEWKAGSSQSKVIEEEMTGRVPSDMK